TDLIPKLRDQGNKSRKGRTGPRRFVELKRPRMGMLPRRSEVLETECGFSYL
ncbi:hypothetical protein MKW98_003888, partial [Papaver atlanticum]